MFVHACLRATDIAPVAQWNFDEGTGKTAGSATGGDAGTLQGAAGWGMGLVGAHALTLPGRPGDFVDVSRSVIDTSRSFTVAVAVKLNRGNGYQTFVSVDGEHISGFFLQFRDDTQEFALTLPGADGTDNITSAIASSHIEPETGVWYHLAGVYDAAARTVSLYVDGVLQETVPAPASWQAAGHLVIGRGKFAGNPVDFVDGSIDDVRIYALALPASSALTLAKADLPPGAFVNGGVAPLPPASLAIHVGQPGARVNPMLYGLMTEEISHSYDGGLYGELIQNRAFKDDPNAPAHWSVVRGQRRKRDDRAGFDRADERRAAGQFEVHGRQCLRQSARWRGEHRLLGYPGQAEHDLPRVVLGESRRRFQRPADGRDRERGRQDRVCESRSRRRLQRLEAVHGHAEDRERRADCGGALRRFRPSRRHGLARSRFRFFRRPSTIAPTANRPDLMEKMAAMQPAFLRFPGGNYLEGDAVIDRFDWKRTIVPIADRPGHRGPWGYRSTDGMGLMEFLDWCDDLHMEPLAGCLRGLLARQLS